MKGGLKLEPHKAVSTAAEIGQVPRPRTLVLPLMQHAGSTAVPVVTVGEKVKRFQPLARPDGFISAGMHAPVSGTVVAIEDRTLPHPSGLPGPCIVLDSDDTDRDRDDYIPRPDWPDMDPSELRQHIRQSGIVGLGGAAFPTHVKLTPATTSPIHTLILNGAECEPYISCDDRLLRERADAVLSGAEIMMHALRARRCIIAVEADKPEAIASLEQALQCRSDTLVATAVEVRPVPAKYPQGGERQLIRTLTGESVPRNGLPLDIGIVCHNVGTAAAVDDAVIHGRPLVSRVVTVTGGAVAAPRNVEALFGTPVRELIEACGGYLMPPERILVGGPMMGHRLVDDTVPVVKGTNCIIAAAPGELATPGPAMPCIRCGECVEVCPAELLPQQLHWAARASDLEEAESLHLFDCIECGCCDLVCPSHIPLVDAFRWAKGEIFRQETERRRAEVSKRRYDARVERLEAERRERDEKLKAKRSPQAIEAALARISKRDGESP